MSEPLCIRAPASRADYAWSERLWGLFAPSPAIVRIACSGSERVGSAAFRTHGADCRILALAALDESTRDKLLVEVERECAALGRARVCVSVPSDELETLRFYQRHEYRMTTVHRQATRDTIELEKRLAIAVPDSPDVSFW